jgi:YVTN family beta-propeller protein
MKGPVQTTSTTSLGRAVLRVALALLVVLFAAGAARAQVKAYVASTGNTSVLELDTATNTATATITGTGSRHLSFSRNGAFLYSTTFNAVQVIDTATNMVVANIPTGNIATNVVESPNGFLYVCNNGSATVSIIDTTTYTVTSTLSPVLCQTVAITPDGSSVWVSTNDLTTVFPTIAVIDTATNAITTTFAIGSVIANAPFWIAFSPDGAFAYAAGFPANSVSVIDTASHATVATVPVGSFPTFVALTSDGAFAYVANLTANSVSVIDTATNTVVATVPVGAFPRAIAFTPDGASAYVTNFNDNSISVIDTATNTVTQTFPFGSRPWGIAITRLPNVPPVLASDNASVTVNEGQTAANTGTVTDANHDTVTLTASVGTVVNNGNGTWSWSFLTSDGPTQSQTVTITGNDGQGGTATTSFALVVNNVPPTIVSVTNNGPVITGNPATITVVATDPAGANDPLTYSFDCNNDGVFEIGPQSGNSATCTFASVGSHTVNVRVADDDGGVTTGSTVVTVLFPPPNCSNAVASPNLLWPPNHKFVSIQISGIVNPAPGAVTISVTSIFQDEPVQSPGSGNTSPDATGVGTSTPSVRAERDGDGDGRVYHIAFTATGASGSCTGSVTVGVPHDQGHGGPVDEGALYDSTQP